MSSFEGDKLVVFLSEIGSDKKGGLVWEKPYNRRTSV